VFNQLQDYDPDFWKCQESGQKIFHEKKPAHLAVAGLTFLRGLDILKTHQPAAMPGPELGGHHVMTGFHRP
jgi:hypothetical protein